jgi:hypothetical protein
MARVHVLKRNTGVDLACRIVNSACVVWNSKPASFLVSV